MLRKKIFRTILVWLGILGIMFLGIGSGTLKAEAKEKHHNRIVHDEDISTPTFSSPDKSNVYYDGQRITIIADYGKKNLNVTADLTVIDKTFSSITPAIGSSDGTYKLKTLRLSGTSLVEGSDIAIPFTAIDEAGHVQNAYSTYLVTIKLRPTNPGSNLQVPDSLKVIPGDSQVQIFWSEIPGARKIVISYKDENNILRQLVVSKKYSDAIIHNLKNGFTYTFYVAGQDKDELVGPAKSIKGTPVAPVTPIIPQVLAAGSSVATSVTPAISSGVSTTKKVSQSPKQETVTVPSQVAQVQQNENSTASKTNWNKLLLAISILIIAAGAAVGGYYGYEWYMAKHEEPIKPQGPRSKNRW